MANYITLILISLTITGCASIFIAQPGVLYKTNDTIGIKYCVTGEIDCWGDSTEAMEIVSKYCNGKYEVTNRDSYRGWTTIDAKCL